MKTYANRTENNNLLINYKDQLFFYTDEEMNSLLKIVDEEEWKWSIGWSSFVTHYEIDVCDKLQSLINEVNDINQAEEIRIERNKQREIDFLAKQKRIKLKVDYKSICMHYNVPVLELFEISGVSKEAIKDKHITMLIEFVKGKKFTNKVRKGRYARHYDFTYSNDIEPLISRLEDEFSKSKEQKRLSEIQRQERIQERYAKEREERERREIAREKYELPLLSNNIEIMFPDNKVLLIGEDVRIGEKIEGMHSNMRYLWDKYDNYSSCKKQAISILDILSKGFYFGNKANEDRWNENSEKIISVLKNIAGWESKKHFVNIS